MHWARSLKYLQTMGSWALLFDINFNLIPIAVPGRKKNVLGRQMDNKVILWSVFNFWGVQKPKKSPIVSDRRKKNGCDNHHMYLTQGQSNLFKVFHDLTTCVTVVSSPSLLFILPWRSSSFFNLFNLFVYFYFKFVPSILHPYPYCIYSSCICKNILMQTPTVFYAFFLHFPWEMWFDTLFRRKLFLA